MIQAREAQGGYFDRKPTLHFKRRDCGALLSEHQKLWVVAVLAETQGHGPILGLGEYFGARHATISDRIEGQFGKITKYIWIGELELVPASSDLSSSFAIARGINTARMSKDYSDSVPLVNSSQVMGELLKTAHPEWLHPQVQWLSFTKGNGRQHLDERLNFDDSGDSARHAFTKAFFHFTYDLDEYQRGKPKKAKLEQQLMQAQSSLAEEKAQELAADKANDPKRDSLSTERWIHQLEKDVTAKNQWQRATTSSDFSLIIYGLQILHENVAYIQAPELEAIRRLDLFFKGVNEKESMDPEDFVMNHLQDWRVAYGYLSERRATSPTIELIPLLPR